MAMPHMAILQCNTCYFFSLQCKTFYLSLQCKTFYFSLDLMCICNIYIILFIILNIWAKRRPRTTWKLPKHSAPRSQIPDPSGQILEQLQKTPTNFQGPGTLYSDIYRYGYTWHIHIIVMWHIYIYICTFCVFVFFRFFAMLNILTSPWRSMCAALRTRSDAMNWLRSKSDLHI